MTHPLFIGLNRSHMYVALAAMLFCLASCMDSLPEHRGPYLSWKDDPKTTMTITWEHLEATPNTIKWGEGPKALTHTINLKAGKRRDDLYYHFTATIKNLTPNTDYYYTVPGLKDEAVKFRTAPRTQETDFSFLLYGDSCEVDKERRNEHYDIVKRMNEVKTPNPIGFVISSGDLSPVDVDIYGWDLHFDAIRNLADHLPYFTPFGNHDWNRSALHDMAQAAIWIHEFPPQSNANGTVSGFDGSSYAFGYGAAYFIFIGYDKIGLKKGSEFNKWLESQLARAMREYTFTFVDFHVPPFDRRDSGDKDNLDMLEFQAKLFHRYRVTMVFSGHNHVFAHHEIAQKPTGEEEPVEVTYIISGGGGQDLRKAFDSTWDNKYGHGYRGKTVFSKSTNHFIRVDVDGAARSVTLTAFDKNGNKFYGPFKKQSDRKKQ